MRRLVRAVRLCPVRAFPQVERPGRFAASQLRPTPSVHLGYTSTGSPPSLQTGQMLAGAA
jgi:hypothetical protein